MSTQADKLRALILNIAVIANTLNRPLFHLTKILNESQDPEGPDNDGTINDELWSKAEGLKKSICDLKNACDKKY